MSAPGCRLCQAPLARIFVDLGVVPLVNAFVEVARAECMEPHYPLKVFVCERCLLVQLPQSVTPEELFGDYPYFSSFSDSWLAHAEAFAELATERLGLGGTSRVVEVASNDGYLLRHFQRRSISVLGVEPARNVARVAIAAGIPTRVEFFGAGVAASLVAESGPADLVVGNNVLAHVPDLHDFTAGLAALVAPRGAVSLEFPHLLRLIESHQFDTIFHEHFSYLSLHVVRELFERHGLTVVDVEELPTHGGSLRVWAHPRAPTPRVGESVARVLCLESEAALDRIDGHLGFMRHVEATKRRLLERLLAIKDAGRSIAGYGAPGKGTVLLNYCGIGSDFLDYTVDRNPLKQGRLVPGVRVPVFAPEHLRETRPDYVLILPWNLKDEIIAQHGYVRDWGGQFIVPVPDAAVV